MLKSAVVLKFDGAEVPVNLGGSSGQGRKCRSEQAEVPVGAEVPAKFRPCSGIAPLSRSNIQGGFRGLSELGRNVGGSSGGRKFRSPGAEVPAGSFLLGAGRHLESIWPEVPVLGGGSSGLGAVAPSSSFPALSSLAWSPWLASWSMYLIEHRVLA